MRALLASGRLLDLILAGVVMEAAILVALFRATGRGVRPGDLLANLAAGACLLLAMRLGMAGAWWGWVCACLAGGLACHVADLRTRWR